ncbi:MarR family transcriptional regulator [Microbacterium sp. NPDC096154]|uniref:MarR family winged helix-turn-helix transcriptional regulator n=1 Tax=Microbacterium sp. NPDC096154 TaxID=3155549 RepID=UPI0033252634
MTTSPAPVPEAAGSSPHPAAYTGHLLRRAQQVHLAAWNRHVSLEYTSTQFAALSMIARRPGMSQADLGAELDLDRSTIADLVRRLVARELIHRDLHPEDRRRKALALTERGRAALAELQPRVAAIEPLVTGGLDAAQRAQLRDLLEAVLAAAGESGLLSADR